MKPDLAVSLLSTESEISVASNAILSFRKLHKLSRLKLSHHMGVSSATISRWENGQSTPSPSVLERLKSLDLTNLEGAGVSGSNSRLQHGDGTLASRKAAAARLSEEQASEIELSDGPVRAIPTAWVRNGPPDQSDFHTTLIKMQTKGGDNIPSELLARRYSLIQEFDGTGFTAQYQLEMPKVLSTSWNSNYGSHGWHRYVGRFPPHLVRALLNRFGADSNTVVCDPFSGSGTTAVECRLLGIPFEGIEICPLSCLISRTKSRFPSDGESLSTLAQKFSDYYHAVWTNFVGERDISLIPHAEIIARQGNPVPYFSNVEKWMIPAALLGVSIAVQFSLQCSGFEKDALMLALSAKMRSIGNIDVDVVRAEYSKKPRQKVDVCALVVSQLKKMEKDTKNMLTSHAGLIGKPEQIRIHEGSVLEVDFPAGSISHIITSPPYGVEAISYLRTHLLSYRTLVSELKHSPYETRDKTIGSEFIEKDQVKFVDRISVLSPSFREFFAQEVTEKKLLQRTEAMKQFFDDLFCVGEKFKRWLKPGGKVAFVLGNKRLGENLIPADQIVIELFASLGLLLEESTKHKLKTNNSNSSVPWQERVIDEEYVLIFTAASENQ
jgi:DNA modification methylase/transcriptional regulator with XRE-family HTH domain